MLDLLIHSRPAFDRIIGGIGFPTPYNLHLEYTVGPFGGKGKASHTDVMLTSDDGSKSLAIEAKWTESMYPPVKDWPEKGAEKTENQNKVLNGWLGKFGQTYSAAFDDVTYQMLHRAASAAVAGREPRLAYFVFKSSTVRGGATPDELFRQLEKLWNLLGKPAHFPFHLVEIELKELHALPTTKGEATAEAVCAALQGDHPLFAFGPARIRQVGTDLHPVMIDLSPDQVAPGAVR
jgi:hypothetical protein